MRSSASASSVLGCSTVASMFSISRFRASAATGLFSSRALSLILMASCFRASILVISALALSLCSFSLYRGSSLLSSGRTYLPRSKCLTTPSVSKSLRISSTTSVESVFIALLIWPLLTLPLFCISFLASSFCFTENMGASGFAARSGFCTLSARSATS